MTTLPLGFLRQGAYDLAFSDLQEENADQQRSAIEDLGSEDYQPYGGLQDALDVARQVFGAWNGWQDAVNSEIENPHAPSPEWGGQFQGPEDPNAWMAEGVGPTTPPGHGFLGRTLRQAAALPFGGGGDESASYGGPGPSYPELTDPTRPQNRFIREQTQPLVDSISEPLGKAILGPFANEDYGGLGVPQFNPEPVGEFAANNVVPRDLGSLLAAGYPLAERVPGIAGALADRLGPGGVPELSGYGYHWTPDANVDPIMSQGLNQGSWLADSPERAAALARIPNRISTNLGFGEVSPGQVFRFPIDEGMTTPSRTTLTREPAWRTNQPLEGGEIVPREVGAPAREAFGRLATEEGGGLRLHGGLQGSVPYRDVYDVETAHPGFSYAGEGMKLNPDTLGVRELTAGKTPREQGINAVRKQMMRYIDQYDAPQAIDVIGQDFARTPYPRTAVAKGEFDEMQRIHERALADPYQHLAEPATPSVELPAAPAEPAPQTDLFGTEVYRSPRGENVPNETQAGLGIASGERPIETAGPMFEGGEPPAVAEPPLSDLERKLQASLGGQPVTPSAPREIPEGTPGAAAYRNRPPAAEPSPLVPPQADLTPEEQAAVAQFGKDVPDLVDPERYAVSQYWAKDMPNPTNPNLSQMRTGLYNAGIDSLGTSAEVRARYSAAEGRGVKLPQAEPPSGPPDAMDYAARDMPQRQAAASGNPPAFDEVGRPLPGFDTNGEPIRQMDTGAPPPGWGEGHGGPVGTQPPPGGPDLGGNGDFGGGHGRPFDDSWSPGRVLNEVIGLLRLPIRTGTLGFHGLRMGVGEALSHPGEGWQALKDYGTLLRDPAQRAAINERLNELPFINGDAPTGSRWADMPQGKQGVTYPKPLADKAIEAIPVVGNVLNRNTEATFGYLNSLRKLVYNSEAERLARLGEGVDPRMYQDTYNAVNHAGGLLSHTRNPLASTFGYSPQAMGARFMQWSDMAIGSGAPTPFSAGSRAVAIKNMLAIAGLTAAADGLGSVLGAQIGAPSWTRYGLNTATGKAIFGSTKEDWSAGQGPIFRLFVNLAHDVDQGGKNMRDNLIGHLGDYFGGQLGPVPQEALNLASGYDAVGNPVSPKDLLTLKGERQIWAPIAANSIIDALDTPGGNVWAALPSLGATAVQTTPAKGTGSGGNRLRLSGSGPSSPLKPQAPSRVGTPARSGNRLLVK